MHSVPLGGTRRLGTLLDTLRCLMNQGCSVMLRARSAGEAGVLRSGAAQANKLSSFHFNETGLL